MVATRAVKALLSLGLAVVLSAAAPAEAQTRRARPDPTATQDAPELTDVTAAAISAWRKAHVEDKGYIHAFDWEDLTLYVRPAEGAKATDPQLRLWVREEFFKAYRDDEGAHRSTLSLLALDCPLGRFRTLTFDEFPKLNLGGEPLVRDSQTPEWHYPRPESLDEHLIYYGCVLVKRAAQEDR